MRRSEVACEAADRLASRNRAGVSRVDAGPAAIAFTVLKNFSGDLEGAGMIEKGGRFLLAEAIGHDTRMQRVQCLLDAFVE
jgi:transcription-repair coupling factor (superfamily II helicase)